MSIKDDPRLSLLVGGKSVGARLQMAIDAGSVTRHSDGALELTVPDEALPSRVIGSHFIMHYGEFRRPCFFLNRFLFKHAYGESAVPFNCRNCYKVNIRAENLRQLVAAKGITETTGYTAKSGMELDEPNQRIYGTYIYNLGLDRARAVYKEIRALVDRHEKLGPGVKMVIKRGCTNYEHKCGPSDRYTFDPGLNDVETYLRSLFRRKARPVAQKVSKSIQDGITLFKMVEAAYRLGDDTYKDFTGGKELFPSVVTYSPDGDASTRLDTGSDAATEK